MSRQTGKSVEDKARIVLAVLRGEVSVAEAARREGTSAVSVSKWRDQFLAGGRRLIQRGDGFVATLVVGQMVIADGELTGARPGKLVRS
ncbi:MAG: helix-turn-helix domain-containing protein [bacterium]|nr:helix-turn-helix domain-containing protein [bacterium]MCY3891044.1 helix-turn-helix domain-containing protein [bacterium]